MKKSDRELVQIASNIISHSAAFQRAILGGDKKYAQTWLLRVEANYKDLRTRLTVNIKNL